MSAPGLTFTEIAALLDVPALEMPAPELAMAKEATSRITAVASIASATASSLVFAEDEETLQSAMASRAGLILTGFQATPLHDARVMQVAAPRYAFALCARELAKVRAAAGEGTEPLLHPAAVVHSTAQMGARVRVGAGAVIEAGVRLGDDVTIGSRAVIAEGVVLGDRVVVQAGAVLGSRGFGYVRHPGTGKYLLFPQQGVLIVEDDVEIGANATIDRGALEETRIGRGTKIDNLVHIGHNCRIGQDVVIAAQVGVSGSCVIEDGAVLAGQVGLSDHCYIGPGVILGGQAGVYRGKMVTGPGEVFAGTPAEPLRAHMQSLAQLRAFGRRRRPR